MAEVMRLWCEGRGRFRLCAPPSLVMRIVPLFEGDVCGDGRSVARGLVKGGRGQLVWPGSAGVECNIEGVSGVCACALAHDGWGRMLVSRSAGDVVMWAAASRRAIGAANLCVWPSEKPPILGSCALAVLDAILMVGVSDLRPDTYCERPDTYCDGTLSSFSSACERLGGVRSDSPLYKCAQSWQTSMRRCVCLHLSICLGSSPFRGPGYAGDASRAAVRESLCASIHTGRYAGRPSARLTEVLSRLALYGGVCSGSSGVDEIIRGCAALSTWECVITADGLISEFCGGDAVYDAVVCGVSAPSSDKFVCSVSGIWAVCGSVEADGVTPSPSASTRLRL